MAIATFRALNAGDMKLKSEPPDGREPGVLHVALLLEGLHLTPHKEESDGDHAQD